MAELKLDLAIDSRKAVAGAKDIGKALDDVADDFKNVEQDGSRSLEDLEGSLRELARTAKTEGGKVERATKDGFDGAGRNVGGFKDEAIQNLSEVASSWTGDLDDMASGVQGLTGGLASALTPGVGIPIAILGAAAGAFLASWQAAAEASEERVNSMFEDFAESGATFVSEELIGGAIKDIVGDTDKYNDALKRAKDTGLDISDILRAMAGDQEAIAKVHRKYVDKRDDEVDAIKESNTNLQDQANKIDAANLKFDESAQWLYDIQRDTGTAAEKAKAYRDAMRESDDAISDIVSGVGTIDEKMRAIKQRNIEVGLTIDDSAYEQWAKRKRYIDVYVSPKSGNAGRSSNYREAV